MKHISLKVPSFDPGTKKREPIRRYFWWSWHPLYPYWSKSCWGGATEAQAKREIKSPQACGMDVYHNKLIRENDDGSFTEVADMPCKRIDVWERIAERNE